MSLTERALLGRVREAEAAGQKLLVEVRHRQEAAAASEAQVVNLQKEMDALRVAVEEERRHRQSNREREEGERQL